MSKQRGYWIVGSLAVVVIGATIMIPRLANWQTQVAISTASTTQASQLASGEKSGVSGRPTDKEVCSSYDSAPESELPAVLQACDNIADQLDSNKQLMLGTMYDLGSQASVKQDDDKAIRWYTLAASNGNAAAQSQLASILVRKHHDYTEAEKWLRLAAEQGVPSAQEELGRMYEYGIDGVVSRDVVSAYFWIGVANRNYRTKRGDWRERPDRLQEVGKKMTSTQIDKAEKQIQAWIAAHPDKP